MPELPEVETTRRGLLPALGARVALVELRWAGIVAGRAQPDALLQGCTLQAIERHGKELLLLTCPDHAPAGPCLVLHLGMTGSLRLLPPDAPPLAPPRARHVHLLWRLADGRRIEFHDPRKFGSVWTFPDAQAARAARWTRLGPDALSITPAQWRAALARTARCVKAVLLDQRLVAGIGNIYADELLHACGVHPGAAACRLPAAAVRQLHRRLRPLLLAAIAARGSTVRDYRDGAGRAGRFQFRHHVYGRSGQRCHRCAAALRTATLAGRTTVWCPKCQPRRP